MAQNVLSNAPYEREWTLVDSFLNQGLPESARTALNSFAKQVETTAPTPNTVAHRIKVLLYQSSINAQLEEQGDWAAIQMLEDSYRLRVLHEVFVPMSLGVPNVASRQAKSPLAKRFDPPACYR